MLGTTVPEVQQYASLTPWPETQPATWRATTRNVHVIKEEVQDNPLWLALKKGSNGLLVVQQKTIHPMQIESQ